MVNILDDYLPNLELLEGHSVKEYLLRVFYPDEYFKPEPGMDEKAI